MAMAAWVGVTLGSATSTPRVAPGGELATVRQGRLWKSGGAPNFRDDPAELRPERVVACEGIRTFEAFAMDLQSQCCKPVTSGNA